MFDTSTLQRLAVALEKAADTQDASAAQLYQAHEDIEADRQKRRAEKNRQYAAAVHAAIAHIKKREKSKAGAIAPTWEEVKFYALSLGWPERDAKRWFNHFESNGWKVSGRSPMKNWQAAANNGFENWKDKNGKADPVSAKRLTDDPPRWREFLKLKEYPYKEHRYAIDWMKTEFSKWSSR